MKFVFEKGSFDHIPEMISICEKNNWEYKEVNKVIFGWSDIDFWDNEQVFAFGTIPLIRHVQNKLRFYPGCWCNWHDLKCSTYLAHWGKYSVHQDYMFMPLGEIKRNKDKIWGIMHPDLDGKNVFFRPDDNDKRFNGELVCWEEFDHWFESCLVYDPPMESLVLVSKPSVITSEYRLIIADRKVITGSQYKTGTAYLSRKIDVKDDKWLIEYAEEIANSTEWSPAPIYVMDICSTGNHLRLLEIGSINCAGLYKCNIPAIMDAVVKCSEKEFNEIGA